MALSTATVAETRPTALRLTSLDVAWTRLDDQPPRAWAWRPFPSQRNRFDAPSHRVRYAARTERGAFRARYADRRRVIRGEDSKTAVVRLSGRLRIIDLRNEGVLDALGVDGEISTGRSDRVFAASALLSARLLEWYGEGLHGIVYSSRTTPQSSSNLAFFKHSPVRVDLVGRVHERTELLAQLVVDDGFRLDLPGWL